MTQTQARGIRFFVFLTLAMSVAAFAAKPVTEPGVAINAMSISSSAVQWQASGSFERLVLTVSGPEGFSYSKEFAAGAPAILRLQDLGAKTPVDGSYIWQLRVVPMISAATKAKLAAARAANDDAAA